MSQIVVAALGRIGKALLAAVAVFGLASAQAETWTTAANEGQTFSGTGLMHVRFGSDTRWLDQIVYGYGECAVSIGVQNCYQEKNKQSRT